MTHDGPLRIACIGRNGQTARALAAVAAGAPDITLLSAGRAQLDLKDHPSLYRFLEAARPHAVINAAAYNLVDQAESEPAEAMAINADGPRALARWCRSAGVSFIHMSTDCVFDGEKDGAYTEQDAPNPLSAYGRSKLAGEQAVLAENPQALVTRVCWVFSEFPENFVTRLLARAQNSRSVDMVSDQWGAPTYAQDIARALLKATRQRAGGAAEVRGLLHLAASEFVSRTTMAAEILAASAALGGPTAELTPVLTASYASPAKRPLNARLDNSRAAALLGPAWTPWREAVHISVAATLARMKHR